MFAKKLGTHTHMHTYKQPLLSFFFCGLNHIHIEEGAFVLLFRSCFFLFQLISLNV